MRELLPRKIPPLGETCFLWPLCGRQYSAFLADVRRRATVQKIRVRFVFSAHLTVMLVPLVHKSCTCFPKSNYFHFWEADGRSANQSAISTI